MQHNFAVYNVAFKILLRKGDKILFLRTTTKKFDWPGGRIDDVEHYAPLAQILDREVQEELGDGLQYKLGNIAFQFRRHFESLGHIFLTAYEAEYVSGEIILSDEHESYEWLRPEEALARSHDFLQQEEYEALKKYFEHDFKNYVLNKQ